MAAFLHRYAGEPAPAANAPTFTDVPSSSPFHTAIRWMAGASITTGQADGTFQPNGPVTRQAMAAFLWRFAGQPTPAANAPTFTDVASSSPFLAAIRWMASTSITTGYPDGTFRPNEVITRQTMAAFLHRLDAAPL